MGGLAAASLSTRAWAGPRPVVRRDFVLCLDPGHGGDNDGCRSADGRVLEKHLTLQTAVALQAAVLDKLDDEGEDVRQALVSDRDRDAPGPRQRELFAPQTDPVVDELKQLDLDDMTPRQAVEWLRERQGKLR